MAESFVPWDVLGKARPGPARVSLGFAAASGAEALLPGAEARLDCGELGSARPTARVGELSRGSMLACFLGKRARSAP